jgi:hypothetical protein
MGRPKKGEAPRGGGRIPQVAVKLPQSMRDALDEELVQHRKDTGDVYRIADFIRDAIAEKLARIHQRRRKNVSGAKGPGLQQATGT